MTRHPRDSGAGAPRVFDPRRPAPSPAALPCQAFGDCRLDLAREQLLRDGVPRPMRRQAFAVLCVLVQRAPALVTLEELLDAVWGHRAISPSALPQAMRDLRRALGDDARRPNYIETRLRRGYRLIPTVRSDAARDIAARGPTLTSRPVVAWTLSRAANDDLAA